jgi:hypothetical protein
MTREVFAAVSILDAAAMAVEEEYDYLQGRDAEVAKGNDRGLAVLVHAIQHIANPDRNVYPKTRRGTKTKPVILSR